MSHWTVHLEGGPKGDNRAAVAVGNKVYIFGEAYAEDMDQIEVHVFNTLSLRWMKLPAVRNRRGKRPLEVPSRRLSHTAVQIEDIIYIWGGVINPLEYSNVLYAFNVDNHVWFTPKISGTVPEARRDHSACVTGKVMYIYGGYNWMTGRTNDIYRLDTTTMVWTLINTGGTSPLASSGHSATIIGTKMFVFGGQGGRFTYHNNIDVFDTETSCWLSMPSAQLRPKVRAGHSAFAYNGELYIFGGCNSTYPGSLNSLWKFKPQTFSWKKVHPKGRGPSSLSSLRCCIVGDWIILFGGWHLRCTTPCYDLSIILDLCPCLKTLCKLAVIQYGLEQSGLPHNIRWELAAMTRKYSEPSKKKSS